MFSGMTPERVHAVFLFNQEYKWVPVICQGHLTKMYPVYHLVGKWNALSLLNLCKTGYN